MLAQLVKSRFKLSSTWLQTPCMVLLSLLPTPHPESAGIFWELAEIHIVLGKAQPFLASHDVYTGKSSVYINIFVLIDNAKPCVRNWR